jgi:hypothetical protein
MNISEICSGMDDSDDADIFSLEMEDGALMLCADFGGGISSYNSLGRAQIGQLIAFLQWAQLRATDELIAGAAE